MSPRTRATKPVSRRRSMRDSDSVLMPLVSSSNWVLPVGTFVALWLDASCWALTNIVMASWSSFVWLF